MRAFAPHLLLAGVTLAGPAATQRPPNVVLLLADDLGWSDVACYGHEVHRTPHLDALARAGLRLTAAYSNGPNCAPTRACLMTGQYTPRHGIYTVGSAKRGKAALRKLEPPTNRTTLPDDAVTMAEWLARAGYRSAAIGKWHLGDDPTTQGFDLAVAGNRAGHPRSYFSPYSNPDLADGPEGEHLTARLTDEAERFVRAHRDRPFLLYMSYFAVHTPIQAPKALEQTYREAYADRDAGGLRKRATYAAMLEALDTSVGRLIALLDELDLTENTLVVFVSDNGGHANFTTMAPLRGSKGMLYEGGVRVPCIARWPGRIAPGTTSDVPVSTADLLPTVLDVAGLDWAGLDWAGLDRAGPDRAGPDRAGPDRAGPDRAGRDGAAPGGADREADDAEALPAAATIDGESLLPLLTGGEAPARDALFWHFPAYLQGYRKEHGPWRTTPAGAIRRGRHKLIEWFEDGRFELYDLVADPGESNDLAQQRPALAAELRARLATWREEVDAAMPTPR